MNEWNFERNREGRPGVLDLLTALSPPVDFEWALGLVPEVALAEGVEQSAYHHLDTLGHVREVIEGVERELSERKTGASVPSGRIEGLRLAALLHDVAKPETRGEYEGRVIFVAHDSLGASLSRGICLRLGASALQTDMALTLTALHLKIGFMDGERTDYPKERLVRAAGPFGEELAVLSWADRMAARGPSLREEHVERHRALCREFLAASRSSKPRSEPDYEEISRTLGEAGNKAATGYAAALARLYAARGTGEEEARERAGRMARTVARAVA